MVYFEASMRTIFSNVLGILERLFILDVLGWFRVTKPCCGVFWMF